MCQFAFSLGFILDCHPKCEKHIKNMSKFGTFMHSVIFF